MNNNMDWDSPIYVDVGSSEYVLFKENEEVSFTVTKFEKSSNEKNKIAKLILRCRNIEGLESNVYCDLYLKNEEKNLRFIATFFSSVGLPCQKSSDGRALALRWGEILGATGYAKIAHDKRDNGNVYNRIRFFLSPEEAKKEQIYAQSNASKSVEDSDEDLF